MNHIKLRFDSELLICLLITEPSGATKIISLKSKVDLEVENLTEETIFLKLKIKSWDRKSNAKKKQKKKKTNKSVKNLKNGTWLNKQKVRAPVCKYKNPTTGPKIRIIIFLYFDRQINPGTAIVVGVASCRLGLQIYRANYVMN